jgi:hypothetical protein
MKGQHARKNLSFYTHLGVEWWRFKRVTEPEVGAFAIVAAKGDWQHWWESFRFGELWNHAFIYCGEGLIVEVWQGRATRAPIQTWINADPLWSDYQGGITLDPDVGRAIAERAKTLGAMRSRLRPAELVADCWERGGADVEGVERARHVHQLKAVIEFWSPDDAQEVADERS